MTAMEMEKIRFLQTLHHDKKGGQMIRLQRHGDQMVSFSTCDIDELAATGTDLDTYTTINTFKGIRRKSEAVFNFESIYIDIDCHTSDDSSAVEAAKERTLKILQESYENGALAAPTLITDTGRGYGLQYCLKRSIANTWRAEKMILFFKKVRKAIFEKYKEILDSETMVEVDGAVLDDARVCRLPGTYNTKAGRFCRLISASENFYELSELVQSCHLWDWKTDEEYAREKEEREKKRKSASGSVVSFAEYRLPFLTARLEQLEKLQELRGENCEGYREQMLFITYSALVQLDPISAAQRLQEMNGHFSDPLPQAELDHIIQETDQSVGHDHRGFYKLSNAYVIDTLSLTDVEIRELGIGQGLKRSVERQAARDKKKETREKIIELLSQADSLTYAQIAEATGVSRRTVCTIAKNVGLMRYARVAERQNDTKKTTEIISIDSIREGSAQPAECAKIATGSVCVPFPVPVRISFSTSAERGAGGEDFDWLEWLQSLASSTLVARELISIYHWSGWDSLAFGNRMEALLNRKLPSIVSEPERLEAIRDLAAETFFKYYKMDCAYLFGVYDVAAVLPSVWKLFSTTGNHKQVKKRLPVPVVDIQTETPEQREARINRYLKNYKDQRFEIIERTDEYKRRLDPAVLRMLKVTCMQVKRLQRDFCLVENKKVATADIKECFEQLSYKDLVVICERMAHHETIKTVAKPFFYIVQAVWKYKNPEAASDQMNRIKKEKSVSNGFNNFESRTYDFDFEKFFEINAVRKISGLSPLSRDEFTKLNQR